MSREHPFSYSRFHIVPVTGDLGRGFAQDYYACEQKLPGFNRYGDGPYRHKRNTMDPVDPLVVAAQMLSRRDEIMFGLGTGGIIQEWRVLDDPLGLDVQWINHADWAGRSFQSTMFWTSAVESGLPRIAANPTWGGSWHSEFPGMDLDVLPGYEAIDVLQGGQNTHFQVLGNELAELMVYSEGYGLEWDPDGQFVDATQVTGGWGGSPVDPIQSSREPFSFRVRCNVNGRSGLHRIDSEIRLPAGFRVLAEDSFSSVPFTLHPRFMFDEAWAYRSDTGGWTALHEPSLESLDMPVVEWKRLSAANLRGQLPAPHLRRGGMMGRVLGASNLGPQWRRILFDQGPLHFRIDPQPDLPSGGRLACPEFALVDFENAQGRFVTADHVEVGTRHPQASHSQTGGYWDISPFCEGPNAFIYRALPGLVHPWSLGQDFAVGMYWPRLSRRLPHGQQGLDQLHWRSARGPAIPDNGTRSPSTLTLHWSRGWGPGAVLEDTPALRETMFLLLGSFDQVSSNVEYLSEHTEFGA